MFRSVNVSRVDAGPLACLATMRKLLVCMAVFGLLAVACGSTVSDGSGTESAADQTEATETEEDPVDEDPVDNAPVDEDAVGDAADTESVSIDDAVGGVAEVVLLDAGAEPRVELRFAIAPTCSELVTINQIQELAQVIDNTPVPSDGAIGNVTEMEVTTQPNGENFDTRSEIISARADDDVPEALAEQINGALESMSGVTTLQTITPRGELVPGSARVEGAEGPGAAEGLLQGLSQAQAPFPAEAVGVGAQWQTTSTIQVQGLDVTSITTTEVVSIDGTVVELAAIGMQEVPEDAVMNLGGISAEVLIWEANTTAESTVDLSQVNPIQSTIRTTLIQQLDFQVESGLLDQEVISEISLASTGTGCTAG